MMTNPAERVQILEDLRTFKGRIETRNQLFARSDHFDTMRAEIIRLRGECAGLGAENYGLSEGYAVLLINAINQKDPGSKNHRILWAVVADLCGVGSTTAQAICRKQGWDPDRPAIHPV